MLENNINCDFKRIDGYSYTPGQTNKMKKERLILLAMNVDVDYTKLLAEVNLPINGTLKQKHQVAA